MVAEDWVAGSVGCGGCTRGWRSGLKYSTTRRAAAKIPVCIIWILIESAKCRFSSPAAVLASSNFLNAVVSSLRTPIHSEAFKLLC